MVKNAPFSNKMMALAGDFTGGVYVTGQALDPLGQTAIATWRYNNQGQIDQGSWPQYWVPNPYAKVPVGMVAAADLFGGVYVAGTIPTQMQGTDIVVLYYSANGSGGLVATF